MSDQHLPEKIGLALSGGGFRATLFHLGVVRALAEAGLLSRITHITSVSGGSVLGAHLVLNWESYAASSKAFDEAREHLARGGDPAEALKKATDLFNRPTERLLDFIGSDIRNDILRRIPWLLLGTAFNTAANKLIGVIPVESIRQKLSLNTDRLRVVEALTRSYERLFGTSVLKALKKANVPQLAILSTDVESMEHAWFSAEGFCQQGSDGKYKPSGPGVITIAQSVAASSAFPALFSPVRLDGATLLHNATKSDSFVTDAGVYDNLGVSGFLGAPFPEDDLPVFVSDATATSDWSAGSKPNFLTNLLRSIDIMQQRTAQLQRERVDLPKRDAKAGHAASQLESQGRFLLFDIAREDIRDEPNIDETVQRHLSYIRTDLDAFSPEEMRLLVHHGYCVAWHALRETKRLPHAPPSHFNSWADKWPPARTQNESVTRNIDIVKAGRRSSIRFFSLSEGMGLLNAATLLFLIVAPLTAIWAINEYRNRKEVAQINANLDAEKKASAAQRTRYARGRIDSYHNFSPKLLKPEPLADLASAGPDPGYANLRISSFEKLFDLRKWQRVPPGQNDRAPLEPAFQQTIYTLYRENSATRVRLVLKTGGYGIMPEVPSLRSQFYQLATPGGLYAKEIFVEINLEEIPPQTDYPVLVNATYWNGFQGEIESAAFAAQTASDSGIMVIIFPENRVPRRFNFWRKSTSESPVEMIPAPFFVPHSNGFYIEVNKPTVKCTYGIVFTWTDEGTGRASEITPSLDTSLIHPSVTPK